MSGHPHDEAREVWWKEMLRGIGFVFDPRGSILEERIAKLESERDELLAREEAERVGREQAETRLAALDAMIAEVEARRRKWTTPGILRGDGPFVIPFPLASSLEKLAALSAREPGKEPS